MLLKKNQRSFTALALQLSGTKVLSSDPDDELPQIGNDDVFSLDKKCQLDELEAHENVVNM